MSWIRVDDGFATHNKVLPLSDSAVRLWLMASCWSRLPQNLKHEGKIQSALLDGIAQHRYSSRKLAQLAQELVDAKAGGLYEHGLWLPTGSGWLIHDWHTYGPGTADADSVSVKRSEAGKRGAASRWQTHGKRMANADVANGKTMPPVPVPVPVPGEKEIPQPPEVKSGSGQRCLDSLTVGSPARRPDVQRVYEAWKTAFDLPSALSLRDSWAGGDALHIATAIDHHGEDQCLLVARRAPEDGMVSGRSDENKVPHASVGYIFGNEAAFTRILADALKHEAQRKSPGALSVIAKLKAAES